MSRLTPAQRRALVALADGGEHSPARLGTAIGTGAHGAARTAASLVRKGHALRLRDRGRVIYKITGQGLAQVDHSQERLA